MIDENKFRAMLTQLLAKSKADKVRWVEDSPPNGEYYCVVFSDAAVIAVHYYSQQSAPDTAWASLVISGRLAVSIDAEDGDPNWGLLKSLRDDAQRCIFGFDRALDAIEKALDSDDVAGLLPEESPPAPPPADIPF